MNDRRKIEENIIETETILSMNRNQERYINEKRVIHNMKENPKVLFDYIKKQKDNNKKIGPLKIGEEYIYDTKELCKILVEQYNSQYSRRIQKKYQMMRLTTRKKEISQIFISVKTT